MTASPCFSVLISSYNRAEQVKRCVLSVSAQTFTDFEIVVVDDASGDDTEAVLAALGEERLRVVRHDRNLGISPARATGVDNARGEWFVILDSDWELFPHALARLRTAIDTELPSGVRIIRSRIQWENGRADPTVIPDGVSDYEGRLRWLEIIATQPINSDAGHCMHRAVFESTNYYRNRRGGIETLWELDLAMRERSLWLADALARQYDAPYSESRDATIKRVVPRLLRDAPDRLWMADEMLARHGAALATFAPHYRRFIIETAVTEAFLSGDRRAGLKYARAAMRAGGDPVKMPATVALGLISPRLLAYGKAAGRRSRAWRSSDD